jgi:formylglycine-generating enzyme required for sulfatase activity
MNMENEPESGARRTCRHVGLAMTTVGANRAQAARRAKPNTGSLSNCMSSDGAFDMVGNLYERTGDWVPRTTACGAWSPGLSPTDDDQCLAGANTTGEPGVLTRGGNWNGISDDEGGGPLAVRGDILISYSDGGLGFRCAR